MNVVKAVFLFCVLSPSIGWSQENAALLDSANNAYARNKYDLALNYYNKILSSGYESGEIYYNIGNACYKSNQLALAVLNYEKAKNLLPADDDIRYNLRIVNSKLIDKIEVMPQFFIADWWNSLFQLMNEKTWSLMCIVFLWLSLAALVVYSVSKNRILRQAGFFTTFFAFVFSVLFYFVAQKSHISKASHGEGVILSLSVNIKGSPSEEGTSLFILHEGTKVGIVQSNGDWSEIKLSNGNRGWIKSSDLGII